MAARIMMTAEPESMGFSGIVDANTDFMPVITMKGKGKAVSLEDAADEFDFGAAGSPISSSDASDYGGEDEVDEEERRRSVDDDDDEELYFSDVSTTSSRASTSHQRALGSPVLGDFVFDSDEDEYEDYLAIVNASASSTDSKKKTTRKGSSGFFFLPRRPSTSVVSTPTAATIQRQQQQRTIMFPVLSDSMAAQNPALHRASLALADKVKSILGKASLTAEEEERRGRPRQRRGQQQQAPQLTNDDDDVESDRHFERALMFARWQQRQSSGEWIAPEDASPRLVHLVQAVA